MSPEVFTSPAFVALLVGEVLFWVLIAAGLAARYLLRRPRLGAVLLAGTILVDLGILATAVLDIRSGGAATSAHGLAAIYVGVSVAFGPVLIRWADVRAAYRWAGGPAPVALPKQGPERARHEWDRFARWVVAAAICAAVLGVVHLLAGPDADLAALTPWFGRLGLVTVIWFVTGPARFLTTPTTASR
ncbi:hypothetical protein [Actinomycetospora sp. NBC_00405]|uniref:hypothetical protein n=1 Tax=Actinomycetospora sp. NBC_00405 TaxID=2975952 RepID=UPI002E23E612